MSRLLIVLAFIVSLPGLSQNSVKDFLAQGDEAFKAHQYKIAVEYYRIAADRFPESVYAKYMEAECHRLSFAYPKSEQLYEQVSRMKSDEFPLTLFYLGLTQKMNGKYQEAIETLDEFTAYCKTNDFADEQLFLSQAEVEKRGCRMAIDQSGLPFRLLNFEDLPGSVNSQQNDFAACASGDSSIVITSSRAIPEDASTEVEISRLYWFGKSSATWHPTNNVFDQHDFHKNTGSAVYAKNFTKLYFTACQNTDCGIYVSNLKDGKWQPEVRLNVNVNTEGFESKHPNLNKTGDTLFFVSNRPGGKGMNDIYFSSLVNGEEENWGAAQNLEQINTPFNEASPYYSASEKVLVFSSQGHPSYGGFDLFLIKPFGDGKITNMGKPFNSEMDDLYFSTDQRGGYLTSNRAGGFGGFDIYHFDLKSGESIVANLVPKDDGQAPDSIANVNTFILEDAKSATISGNLVKRSENQPAGNVTVILTDKTGAALKSTSTNSAGLFRFVETPISQEYSVRVEKDGSVFREQDLTIANLQVSAVNNESKSNFESVYFDFDKSDIRPEGYQTLNLLVSLIKSNPHGQIEINGFADPTGKDKYNYELSLRRSKAVLNYLVEHGVDPSSLVAIAQGEKNLATQDASVRGMQLNRRVEFVIKGANINLEAEIYIIDPKATLYSISKKFGVTIDALKAANGITTNNIVAYRPIRIPLSKNQSIPSLKTEKKNAIAQKYIVKRGDTVFSIARRFNTTVEAICGLNHISKYLIKPGNVLLIGQK